MFESRHKMSAHLIWTIRGCAGVQLIRLVIFQLLLSPELQLRVLAFFDAVFSVPRVICPFRGTYVSNVNSAI